MKHYHLERHDQEDGSITYEIWDYNPESYRRLCSINEFDNNSAKQDAELIIKSLNYLKDDIINE